MCNLVVDELLRLNQRQEARGSAVVTGFEETRVWQRRQNGWKHVHFHRSPLPVRTA
jgi:calcium/calmodulin-dependent protein kinase (CaM kinase) II